jgi:3'(2'), 5'-bisphosphate nucleotidase
VSTIDPAAAAADLIDRLTAITVSAAVAIRQAQEEGHVRVKADGSPVTSADEAAETVIRAGLAQLNLALPIISEEEESKRPTPTVMSRSYFLVDPLDGTRDFIAGRDEYTVNIAIVTDGVPVIGIIAAPALGLVWRGIVGRGADRLQFSSRQTSSPEPIHTRIRPERELIVMVSRSHLDAPTQAYVDSLPHTRLIGCGSSVKFCRLAEGTADHYPRLGPTHDWDIAAGHAILVAAGGSIIEPDGAPLTYGTPQRLIPAFLAWGGPAPTEGALKAGY